MSISLALPIFQFTWYILPLILALIRLLINKTADPKLRKQLDDCLKIYDISIREIEDAKTALKAHDYLTVNVASDSCMTNAETCSDTLATSAPPLPQENKNMYYLCETFVVVSNHLL